MANSFFNSPWTGLAACILLMAVSGTSSLFSTYANDLKKYSHFNQKTILIISWLKDIVENAGILTAYVAEMFSPRKLILLGSIGRLVSLMVLYATLKGLFPSIMWVQAMAVLLSAVAETTIKAASRTSSLRPFRKMAPMTVFILNGYADMSGMLLTVIFTSSTDISSLSSSIKFLIFLSLFPFVITLISLPALCTDTVTLSGSYDLECGGFGSALKFPRAVENQLMLYWSKKMEHTGKFQEVNEALKMVLFSLQCLARGGIHEHVGCGYHRYSVDKFRHVPHFEKMLYDQGQIASLYLSSSTITTDVFYSCVSWDIFDYLRREVIGQEGEIFSAEDADSAEYEGASGKKEGAFYVWTSKEVDDILGQHAMIFKNHFYIKPMANCALSRMIDPHHEFKGKNVLFGRHNPAEMASKLGMPVEQYLDILGECRKKAFEARSSQPRPHLDDKFRGLWFLLRLGFLVAISCIGVQVVANAASFGMAFEFCALKLESF
ncbi:hypothetical protein SO802_013625 [Lithocarpus litseifolius]|uniref:Nodulin-like domain-containing protein n=1 Tax=Lithocarpus litseifolius TaxID=425828 RepID=A0AAW2D7K5_9ROSI